MDTSNKRPVLPPDQRDQLLIECKADLLNWAKKRFWFMVVLVTVVGFFGFSTLIREAVRMSVDKRLDIELKRVDRAVRNGRCCSCSVFSTYASPYGFLRYIFGPLLVILTRCKMQSNFSRKSSE